MNPVSRFGPPALPLFLLISTGSLLYLLMGGVYYMGADDAVLQSYIYGLYNNGSTALPDTFGCFVLLSSPLNYLHHQFPDINCYDAFQLSLLMISFYYLYKFLLSECKKEELVPLFVITLISLTIAGVFIKPAEFTKTSMLLACMALIQMFYDHKKFGIKSILGGSLFFVALLIRIEGAILAFLITSAIQIAAFTSLKCWLRKNLPAIFMIICVSAIVNWPKTQSEDYYSKIRGFEYTLTDFDRDSAKANLVTQEDSAIFYACTHYFFNDSLHCNVAFFEKTGIRAFDKTPLSLLKGAMHPRVLSQKAEYYFSILYNLKWLVLLCLISIIASIILHSRKTRLVLANSFCILMITFISLWLKPEEHVIGPALAIILLLNIAFIINEKKGRLFLSRHLLSTIIIIALMSGEFYHQYLLVEDEKKLTLYYSSVAEYLELHPSKKTLLNIGSWDEAHHKMFEKNKLCTLPHTYVLDGAILYFDQDYQNYIYTITGNRSFIGQWEYFIKSDDCRFVSSANRMELAIHYLNVVYHRHYKTKCIKEFAAPDCKSEPLGIYKVVEN